MDDGADGTAAALPAPVGRFLDELARQRRLSPHTVAAYRSDLAELARMTAGKPLPQSLAADIRRALVRLHAGGQAPPPLSRKLSAWRRFFAWLGGRGEIAGNPKYQETQKRA